MSTGSERELNECVLVRGVTTGILLSAIGDMIESVSWLIKVVLGSSALCFLVTGVSSTFVVSRFVLCDVILMVWELVMK